jgi:spore coat protein U-like protein
MKKSIFILSLLALSWVFAGIAYAGSVTSTLTISGTLLATCEVSTTPVAFGNYDASADVYANGDISLNCTQPTPYVIYLDAGLYQGGQERFIGNGTPYYLYKDSGLLNEWGDSGYANTYPWGSGLAGTGDGYLHSHIVYGRLHSTGAFGSAAGSYTDTVTVTVQF